MTYSDITITPLLDTVKILDISDEEYFSSKYKDYISNSRLKLINPSEGGTPELFEKGLQSSYSDSFYFGSAVHELVLQPEAFELVNTVERPTAKMGAVGDYLFDHYYGEEDITINHAIKASNALDYYKGKFTEDKFNNVLNKCSEYWATRKEWEQNNLKPNIVPIYMDNKSRNRLNGCLKNVSECKEIQDLLYPTGLFKSPKSLNEATILLDVLCVTPSKDEIILKLKGKLDNFTVNSEDSTITLNDLKTTGHCIEDFGKKSFYHFHYYRQMGMYGWMLSILNKHLYKFEKPTYKCNMLLVSTIPPYNCGVYSVNGKQVKRGVDEFSDLLKRVAFYRLYGK